MKRQIDFFLGVPLGWMIRFLKGSSKKPKGKLKKILIIKLAAAGDTLLLFPVIRSLKKTLPQTEFHWLVSPVNHSLAVTNRNINKFILLKNFSLFSLIKTIKFLKRENYDVIIDFEQWARGTALICYLVGSPCRIGFDTPGQYRSSFFTQTYKKLYREHEIHDFFGLASLINPLPLDMELESLETDKGILECRDIIRNGFSGNQKGLRVLLHPGCGYDGRLREWPLAQYAVLGNWLINNFGARIYISGGPDEVAKTAQLQKLLDGKAKNIGGRGSWQGTISIVKNMDLVISGNTGIMHLAAALKKPQVALHGPTNPDLWGPLNPNALVLQSSCPQCPSLKLGFEYHPHSEGCMNRIQFSEVKAAVLSLFDKIKPI